MIKFLDLHHQYLSIKSDIDKAIQSTIEQSLYIGGTAVNDFEVAFAEYQQAEHCVGVANGTDALEIAIQALALPPGSEIIVPANSFIASSESVTRSGHRVVFADIDPVFFTLNLEDVSRRIGPNTSAIIAVHLYGHSCDMDRLRALATSKKLKLIEDCAQAHGAEFNGKRVGALGDIGTFSFYPGKNLGAYGDAGAIVTNNADLAQLCRMIANHGRIDKYNHIMEGRNSRLDGLQAAILGAKLKRLDHWIDQRNLIGRCYIEGLRDIDVIELPQISPRVRHAFHLFVIKTDKRDELKQFLAERGIETGIHYPIALPKLKAYDYLHQSEEPMLANRMDGRLLSLPIGEHLSVNEVETVIAAVRSFFEHIGSP